MNDKTPPPATPEVGASEWYPATARDYQPDYSVLRSRCPVAHSDQYGGFWSVFRYDDVSKAARDYQQFRSGQPFVELPDLPRSIPIGLNPPEHTEYRRFLSQFFTARRIEALRPAVERIIAERLDPLIDAGQGDFAAAVASFVPAQVLGEFMGLTPRGARGLMENMEAVARAGGNHQEINRLQATMWDMPVEDTVQDRRTNPRDPKTDLMTAVLQWERHGARVPDDDVRAIGVQIFAAGAETTMRALSSAAAFLARDPALQSRVRADRKLIGPFIEETLRVAPPLHQGVRQLAADLEIHGKTLPAGCDVALNWAAANMDESKFPRASEFMAERKPNLHFTFGFGIHQCLGAPIARLELSVLVNRLLDRTTAFTLAEPPVPTDRPIRTGYKRVELIFTRRDSAA